MNRLVTLLLATLGAMNACGETIEFGPPRAPIDVPPGYVRVFQSPDGALTVFHRAASSPGGTPDELAVFFESLPAAGSARSDWKTGHEFTWGNEFSWGYTDSRIRIYEGLRVIAGVDETWFAALFPWKGLGVGIAIHGEQAARHRLAEDLSRIASSLGARSPEGTYSGMICGGCGGGVSATRWFEECWPFAAMALFITALCWVGQRLDFVRRMAK